MDESEGRPGSDHADTSAHVEDDAPGDADGDTDGSGGGDADNPGADEVDTEGTGDDVAEDATGDGDASPTADAAGEDTPTDDDAKEPADTTGVAPDQTGSGDAAADDAESAAADGEAETPDADGEAETPDADGDADGHWPVDGVSDDVVADAVAEAADATETDTDDGAMADTDDGAMADTDDDSAAEAETDIDDTDTDDGSNGMYGNATTDFDPDPTADDDETPAPDIGHAEFAAPHPDAATAAGTAAARASAEAEGDLASEMGLTEAELDLDAPEPDISYDDVSPGDDEDTSVEDGLLGEGPQEDQEMPLADHIEEMVRRLAVVMAVVGVVMIVVFPIAEQLINFLWNAHIPGASTVADRRPRVYGPLELLLTEIKVAGLAGFVLGLPIAVYQTYRFMRPGLYPRERRYYLAAVPTSLVLALVGVAFSHFVVLPAIFAYFTSYTVGTATVAFGLQETFRLILLLMGYMALVFQIPLFMMLGIMMGLVSRRWYTEKRLLFWGAFLGVSFLISPDPTGMAPIIIAITMISLFEGTLLLLKWTGR